MSTPASGTACVDCQIQKNHFCQAQVFVDTVPLCLPCADVEPCAVERNRPKPSGIEDALDSGARASLGHGLTADVKPNKKLAVSRKETPEHIVDAILAEPDASAGALAAKFNLPYRTVWGIRKRAEARNGKPVPKPTRAPRKEPAAAKVAPPATPPVPAFSLDVAQSRITLAVDIDGKQADAIFSALSLEHKQAALRAVILGALGVADE